MDLCMNLLPDSNLYYWVMIKIIFLSHNVEVAIQKTDGIFIIIFFFVALLLLLQQVARKLY